MKIINLDQISSKPLLAEVKNAMVEAINMDYHNPSSQHKSGEQAAEALDRARESVAQLIHCAMPKEVVFTSGGTESVNHAVKGVAMANAEKGKHIVTSNIEHNAVIRSLRRLQSAGFKVTSLSVDSSGRVNPQDVADAITDETILVSVMHSNNETGTIQPIEDIGKITRERKVIFHSDAADSVGVVPLDVQAMGVDVLSFASNTFHGPTGVGGLYIRRGTRVFPLLDGGIQENNKRAGAENLIGIIGMGKAAELAVRDMDSRLAHLQRLKDKLLTELPKFIDECILNTHPQFSLPNLVSLSITCTAFSRIKPRRCAGNPGDILWYRYYRRRYHEIFAIVATCRVDPARYLASIQKNYRSGLNWINLKDERPTSNIQLPTSNKKTNIQ
jgi:cysteine desulfurase